MEFFFFTALVKSHIEKSYSNCEAKDLLVYRMALAVFALLILVTMFNSVRTTSPPTSYLKVYKSFG